MDTGYPSLLMLLLRPLLRQNRKCLARTLEIEAEVETTTNPGVGVETAMAALVVKIVAGVVDLRETAHSQGVTAVARGRTPPDTIPPGPKRIPTVETLHPGGETLTNTAT
jgi:hypothetical protein